MEKAPQKLLKATSGLIEAYRQAIIGLEAIIANRLSDRHLVNLEKLHDKMKKELEELKAKEKLLAPT